MAHPELGARVLDNVAGQITDIGKIEAQARMDGRNMTMVLAPTRPERFEPLQLRSHHVTSRVARGQICQPSWLRPPANAGPRHSELPRMPKMKTSKTAAKRFRKTGTGKLRRLQSMRQHLFETKPSTRTRRLDGMVDVHSGDEKKIKRLLAER